MAASLFLACGQGTDKKPAGETSTMTRPNGAILIAERFNTPDGRAAYMGAFAQLPTEPIQVARLTELGPEGDTFACGGAAFFYNPNAGTITRYDVADDLSLQKGKAINVLTEGIVGWTGAHLCRSATEAFILNEAGGRVVEWNPTAMTVTRAFDVPRPMVGANLTVQFFEPKVVGDLAYFSLTALNWDTLEVDPRSHLAVFDMKERTLTLDTDDRCQGSLGNLVDSSGAYYQVPEDGAFFSAFSPTRPQPPDCVLRVAPGGRRFDDAYVQRLPAGQSLRSMWPVDDGHTLATLIPTSAMPPADKMWDWYELPVTPSLFNLSTGEVTPYPVSTVQPMNSRKLTLDGKGYYQVYSFTMDGKVSQVDVVRLERAGPVPAFSVVGGDVLTLERLW
ncbi:MAG: hypothetical protein MUC96_03375 [Myxococcaceae bacterium]|nr:hypothetical protein [Myxococcaceae bacterium]